MPTLNWIGKEAVEKHHLEIPYRLLEYDDTYSTGDLESGNLLIQGDNLHALKALLPYYTGKIKCIYIDPPYNTGEEKWRYNDNVNSPEIKKWLNEIVGREGDDLTRHDKWLCMMYPRLQLLSKFLRRDGVIFISIDDNEYANLKLLLDNIFGTQNMLASLIWEGALKNDSKFISVSHDYILCYAKSKEHLRVNKTKWRTRKEGIDEIYNEVEKLRQKYGEDYDQISSELQDWYKRIDYLPEKCHYEIGSSGEEFPAPPDLLYLIWVVLEAAEKFINEVNLFLVVPAVGLAKSNICHRVNQLATGKPRLKPFFGIVEQKRLQLINRSIIRFCQIPETKQGLAAGGQATLMNVGNQLAHRQVI